MRQPIANAAVITAMFAYAVASAQDVAVDRKANKAAFRTKDIKFFENRIAPILKRRCYQCHSHESGKAKGGLVLDSRRGWAAAVALALSSFEHALCMQRDPLVAPGRT